jgi:large conductance mechanosensitive channel
MSFLQDFKKFAIRGNVIDLAVGVIIGGAFGKIVSSLVSDIIMPPIGLLVSNVNFSELRIVLSHKPDGSPSATLNYGSFVENIVEFLIVAFVVFLMVNLISKLRKEKEQEPPPPAPPTKEVMLLSEIRDLLKTK